MLRARNGEAGSQSRLLCCALRAASFCLGDGCGLCMVVHASDGSGSCGLILVFLDIPFHLPAIW